MGWMAFASIGLLLRYTAVVTNYSGIYVAHPMLPILIPLHLALEFTYYTHSNCDSIN